MTNTIMIIDDDINIIQMLKTIIKKNNLGRVVSDLNSGKDAIEEILFYNPDIILIDFLLPYKDGVEIVKNIIEKGYTGKIIMISQVEDEPMISNAYDTGILFFIKKPINAVEVTKVIKNVSHNIELEKSMSMIKDLLGNVAQSDTKVEAQNPNSIQSILSDIGIIGDLGAKDLIKLINSIIKNKKLNPNPQYILQEIYIEMSNAKTTATFHRVTPSAIEQRVRRTIQKALNNIAMMGLDDYYNSKFSEYSTLLFDFKEVKQEMDYIQGKSQYRGKVNIRKFIEGIISKVSI